MKFLPKGMATGIGSVPHSSPEEAVKFIMSFFPEAPYWPQLPLRGHKEGFIEQFIAPLVTLGLVVSKGGKSYFDTGSDEWPARLAQFYETYLAAVEGDQEAIDFFGFPRESASGFYAFLDYLETHGTGEAKYLKGQISGPIALGLALTDQDKRAIYYDPQGRDVLIKTLALQGLNQSKALGRFGLPVIVFVDDPGLSASGQSTYITLNKGQIIPELDSIYEIIHGSGAIVGTHSCAGMDWSILFESTVDIINFDAFGYFDSLSSYVDEMRGFLNHGGTLAWGIVPTSGSAVSDQTVETLQQKLEQNIDYLVRKGFKREVLLSQMMITPSCGTGTLDMDMAFKVHKLASELSKLFK